MKNELLKHFEGITPGPWRVLPQHEEDSIVATIEDRGKSVPICGCTGWGHAVKQWEINATAIAKLPELLEAYKQALQEIEELKALKKQIRQTVTSFWIPHEVRTLAIDELTSEGHRAE